MEESDKKIQRGSGRRGQEGGEGSQGRRRFQGSNGPAPRGHVDRHRAEYGDSVARKLKEREVVLSEREGVGT